MTLGSRKRSFGLSSLKTYNEGKMKKILTLSALFFVFIGFSHSGLFAQTSASQTEFMTLTELKQLLARGPVYGVFDSVPSGTQTKRYQIKIDGIYEVPGLKAVIFSTMHKIAAGMSGSPVYVNGKLLGALASSFSNFSKISWGGIAPFELMEDDQKPTGLTLHAAARSFIYQDKLFTPIALSTISVLPDMLSRLEKNHLGLDLEFFRKNKFLISAQSGRSSRADRNFSAKNLKPGMPIVVDLAEWRDQKGELNTISAVGTITYIDRKSGRVYAFGHPFLDAKKVFYTFRTCRIIETVESDFDAYKIPGEKSDVLGVIDYDSTYGVYGKFSLENLDKLHNFRLELQRQGKTYERLEIRIGDTRTFIPLLVDLVLGAAGGIYNVPQPSEVSTTELAVQLDLKGYPAISARQLSVSGTVQFGGGLIYISSYEVAVRDFISEIYLPLFASSYNFEVSNVALKANFLAGRPPEMRLAAYRFPDPIVWGEDPALEVVFVSQDNSLVLEKRMAVKVDWSKVEMPIYTKETLDTEKKGESIVGGALQFISGRLFQKTTSGLPESERKKLLPDYFLSAQDFLEFFQNRLQATDQKIVGRINIRAKSGLFEEKIAKAESVVSAEVEQEKDGWHIVWGGIKERKETVKNEGFVSFPIEFRPVPSGYIVNPFLSEIFPFEVVKKN